MCNVLRVNAMGIKKKRRKKRNEEKIENPKTGETMEEYNAI